ncbi:MAG: carbamoyl phosphate synthase small subunit, partial [Christensenellales bacterium]
EIIRNTPIATDAVAKVSRQREQRYSVGGDVHIVAIDCGIKQNIIRSFNDRGIDVTVVPWNTTASRIRELEPDGVFISNGPGDPTDVTATISTIRSLIGQYPIFGICLGHQILALAYGGKTYKLKFGHRGGNHPVKNLVTDHIEITSQNHSYAVDRDSLQGTGLEITHVNLLDGTVEGMRNVRDKVFSVQYHPESAPGPNDSGYLFDGFIATVKENKNA